MKMFKSKRGPELNMLDPVPTQPTFVLEFRSCFLRQSRFMLARTTLTTRRAAAGTVLSLIFITGCHHPAAPPLKPASSSAPPKVKFNTNYDAEIKETMDLARKERWEEAQVKADALFEKAPENPMVQRIHSWVAEARQKRREQALEDKIREIE